MFHVSTCDKNGDFRLLLTRVWLLFTIWSKNVVNAMCHRKVCYAYRPAFYESCVKWCNVSFAPLAFKSNGCMYELCISVCNVLARRWFIQLLYIDKGSVCVCVCVHFSCFPKKLDHIFFTKIPLSKQRMGNMIFKGEYKAVSIGARHALFLIRRWSVYLFLCMVI